MLYNKSLTIISLEEHYFFQNDTIRQNVYSSHFSQYDMVLFCVNFIFNDYIDAIKILLRIFYYKKGTRFYMFIIVGFYLSFYGPEF